MFSLKFKNRSFTPKNRTINLKMKLNLSNNFDEI